MSKSVENLIVEYLKLSVDLGRGQMFLAYRVGEGKAEQISRDGQKAIMQRIEEIETELMCVDENILEEARRKVNFLFMTLNNKLLKTVNELEVIDMQEESCERCGKSDKKFKITTNADLFNYLRHNFDLEIAYIVQNDMMICECNLTEWKENLYKKFSKTRGRDILRTVEVEVYNCAKPI